MASTSQNPQVDANTRVARDEPSFIAETSFVRAPLNSRVDASNAVPKSKEKAKQEPLDRIPLDIQEALILQDLLSVLIPGDHITFHSYYSLEDDDPLQGIQFVPARLVERILPLGTYYTAITAFVEQRSHLDFGLVNHALCASVRDMLKDYQTLLCQLEHAFNTSPTFSLQKLWFYVHPTVHTLFLIYQLILELATADDPSNSLASSSSSEMDPEEEARNEALGLGGDKLKAVLSEINSNNLGVAGGSGIAVKGGEVLTIIYEPMQNMSGDPTASKLHGALLNAAGKPYANMLRQWIMTGKLVDPYEELWMKESKFINRGILEADYTDEYWERRYTLRDGSTLSSKQQTGVPLARSQILRECGIEVSQNQNCPDDEEFSMDDPRFHKFLEDAYSHANHTLHGDDVLLREDIKITLADTGLYEFLMVEKTQAMERRMGFEDTMAWTQPRPRRAQKGERGQENANGSIGSLTFDYNVRFPLALSLVISRKTVLRYQRSVLRSLNCSAPFRFLLHLKHVEQSLSMWIEQKTGPWRKRVPEFEVLEPNWRALESKLEKITTVDQLLRDDHCGFHGYMFEGVYADEFKTAQGVSLCQLSAKLPG
ncbi:hypothetical protein M378DRAFT_10123 [Amanita muscaria Koide BX008]|uniref:Spindle pole body component n=1 Tax=Amanita muscaria (strain Koide BX008) TaxID=946122 RepID=A0A0C2SSV7_AMAMK|nr:hypothetical protein M378DRAFT_10123 [Amanita muscaria Koide BX008]